MSQGSYSAVQRFQRRTESLEAMNRFIGEFFVAARLPAGETWRVEFVVEEIFTNMVKYGQGGGLEVELALTRRGEVLDIECTDFDVEPFDLTQLPELDVAQHLAQGRIGGLGLHIVRSMAEDVAYAHQNRTAKVTITLRLEP